ncbi:hypothetical protein TNCV_5086891 [Trichonephila clavipes]|nr:hypothetical protein TNCV_5086891 [Trichonephila clavipes]
MVLVKEDNLPPLQWSLGRVVQVFQETMVLFESWMSRPNEDNSDVLLRSVAYCQLKTELIVQAGEWISHLRKVDPPAKERKLARAPSPDSSSVLKNRKAVLKTPMETLEWWAVSPSCCNHTLSRFFPFLESG